MSLQPAVVEDAAAVERGGLVHAPHVRGDALGDDRRVRDRELQLVGHDAAGVTDFFSRSIWRGVWFETPNARTLPAASSSSNARATSSGSTSASGRCSSRMSM